MFRLKILLAFSMFLLVFGACSGPSTKEPHIIIKTGWGDIEVELYPEKAPKTVSAFLSYVDSGVYKNGSFYRVLNNDNQFTGVPHSYLMQGGIWQTNHKLAISLPPVPHEPTNETGILHTDGTISLARGEPGTAGTEFFICIGDQHGFDYGGENNPDGQGYAAFGKVIRGMDVVRKIYHQPEYNQRFDPPIKIDKIVRK